MAHFAKLSEENVVLQIEVVADADTSIDGVEDEATGIAFLTDIHGWSLWKKCSYNTRGGKHYVPDSNFMTESPDQSKAFRKNYPHIGWKYNPTIDGFVDNQPYSSWTLNNTTGLWEAPVEYPTVTLIGEYNLGITWDEGNQKWLAISDSDPANNYEWNTTTLSWDSV